MILPIFPEGGLTSSVITTVWVGVFVLTFFNLRYGWVLSGLVVPGYIVPLLILRPAAAGVIVFEAILTYILVWVFSEKLSRGRFPGLFGRDRFMGLVLASIAVRVTMDGWLLPIAARWLGEHLGRNIDWQSNLQSFGLVVISLMANQFWKPGLLRGLFSFFVVTGISWIIVRYGLMEFTNFRVSGVSYIYEGLASSILASPKAYIILVLTAMIASQMNLRYGWDFSGVLIPALIALQWYQPTKILSSFVEATIIYALARVVMRTPMLAGTTIEGARKLLLFFNVSFAYKLVLGHILVWLALDVKTTDFYGFGYLLSTLLAIKAHDKNIFARVMRSTLEVSLAGAVLGNVIGFILAWFLPASLSTANAEEDKRKLTKGLQDGLITAAVGDAYVRSRGGIAPVLGSEQGAELQAALELLARGAEPHLVASGLRESGFVITRDDSGIIAIAGRSDAGRDLVLFDPQAARDLAVIVPDASARQGIAAAGLALFETERARWLVLTALPPRGPLPKESFLGRFRAATGSPELQIAAAGKDGSRLLLVGGAATALDLAALRSALPGLPSLFAPASAEGNRNEAVLELDAAAIARLIGQAANQESATECILPSTKQQDLLPPDLAQRAFVRFEVAEPLIESISLGNLDAPVVRRSAALAGLVLDQCTLGSRKAWRLSSYEGADGTFLFLPAGDRGKLIQASTERLALHSAATAVGSQWNAGAIFFASTEEGLVGSQRSLFGVVSQALIQSMADGEGEVLQLRPVKTERRPIPNSANLLVAPDWFDTDKQRATEYLSLAQRSGYRPALVDGSQATAGHEVIPNTSLRYLSLAIGKRFTTYWLTGTRRTQEAAP